MTVPVTLDELGVYCLLGIKNEKYIPAIELCLDWAKQAHQKCLDLRAKVAKLEKENLQLSSRLEQTYDLK